MVYGLLLDPYDEFFIRPVTQQAAVASASTLHVGGGSIGAAGGGGGVGGGGASRGAALDWVNSFEVGLVTGVLHYEEVARVRLLSTCCNRRAS
jgi:hypothetical protein